MFMIQEALAKYHEKVGDPTAGYDVSQGDGGKSLGGVPREVLDRAHQLQIEHGTGYDKPFGTPLFRQVTAEQYWKLDAASGWGPENIIFAQGGRDGLNKAYQAMTLLGTGQNGGAVVVSRVPWLSYVWGAYGLGLNVMHAPGQEEEGWRFTEDGIHACAELAAREDRKMAALIITSPDNPTGRTLSEEEQIELAHTALEAGYAYVLFDWMYHWVTDSGPTNINIILQAFSSEERKRLIFLDGITKSLGGSNIRGAHLLADKAVIDHIDNQASHGLIPSFYAQAVAIAAYEMGFEKASAAIVEPTKQSRRWLRQFLGGKGVPFIMGDGYYAFIDIGKYIEASAFKNSSDIGPWLAEEHGVAVVPGVYFSQAAANWVRFSYALAPERTEKAATQLFGALESLL
jgi:aspartate/methionine/tyrosine aminotransferase